MKTPSRCFLTLFALLAALSLSCGGKKSKGPKVTGDIETKDDKILLQLEDADPGLTILLSDGKTGGPAVVRQKLASATKLAEAKVKQLLSRMPSLLAKTGDKTDFAFRGGSQPPPRTGETIAHAFPPKPSALKVAAAGGKLEVTRFAPEGEVPLVPHLSVSFSQPMVAITSHEDSIKTVPVQVSPQPAGKWRWIGTKTLLFDADQRFPMATDYAVRVAKGTKSANGEVLAEDKSFHFITPTVTMKSQHPTSGQPQGLTPAIYLGFDQRIDPELVLGKMSLKAKDSKVSLRMAREEEIKEDKIVFALVEAAKKRDNGRRWLVVVPTQPLPKDASVVVTVGKGTASAEGPLLTAHDQSFNFHTYGPLKIIETRCGWGDCRPGQPFTLRFSNPLDQESFDGETLTIDPALKYKAHVNREWMTIRGQTDGRTTYAVTIPALLKDKFGQTLGSDEVKKFAVGDAHPQLFGNRGLTVADPSAKTPTFDIHSINIRSLSVQIYKVTPKDWETFGKFMRDNPRQPKPAPGRKVFDKNIKLDGSIDRMTDTAIDLSAALNKAGKGHAVIMVEPTSWPDRYKPNIKSWVQVTDIGIDAFTDSDELLAWTTDLATGKPLANVDVSISHTKKQTKSDKAGLATLSIVGSGLKSGERQLLIAKQGDDLAILPKDNHFWNDSSGFGGYQQNDYIRWFSFDDRGMYKPGETVRVKGWVRTFEGREGGDIVGLDGVTSISFQVMGPRGNKIGEGKTTVSRMGGFDLSFKLPKTPNLGHAYVQLSAQGATLPAGGSSNHSFQIQEFRRPEFEVGAEASQGPHIVGKGADVTVSAKYYSGGPLAGADVNWTVRSNATSFTPPNQSDYTFGSWVPWWGWGRHGGGNTAATNKWLNHKSKTNASGKNVLHMDFVSVKPPRPMSVVAEASVMDVNRQAWNSSATLLVHPSDLYIGMKRDRYFVEKNEPIKVEGIVVDQEGKVVTGRAATVRAVRLDWKYEKGEYKQVEEDPQTCEVKSVAKAFKCEFKTPQGGTYQITATISDDLGRPNQSQFTTWVSGGDRPPERNVTQEQVTLIPDKKEYAAGDTAKIMVQAPFFPADAVLSIRRSGIVRTESFHMDSATKTVTVPIREGQVPNLYVQIDLVGSAVRVDDKGKKQPDLPRRPAYAKGTLRLAVPPTKRTLSVAVTPEHPKLAPGAKTSVSVKVTDADGKPVKNAELAIMVVDEAVLALSSYATPNPIGGFYQDRPMGASDYHQRAWIKLAKPELSSLAQGEFADEDDMAVEGVGSSIAPSAPAERSMRSRGGRARPNKSKSKRESKKDSRQVAQNNAPIAVRKNFNALAAFAPAVSTDAKGMAKIAVNVPDNLTRYRVMVIAAANKNHFGKGESNMTARMPLMVRPSPPRFLNFGDRFELPVVLQNQTDEEMTVEVAVRATNAAITDNGGFSMLVPANDRVEVRFPAAAEMAGVARFQVAAASGSYQDANEFSLPVWTPATTEAFATYGEIDKGAIKQPVRMPPRVVEKFGGLEISLSSTQLQALTDAVLYLVRYPYECAEQTSSRILGVAALRDVLGAFKADGLPSKAEIESAVKRDIERLAALQNWDGGFAFWVKGHESWPYISIHAAHALIRAKEKGFTVPEAMLDRSKEYLRDIERHIPHFYSLRTRRMLISYALYTRKRMGDGDVARAQKLIASAGMDKLTMESLGWLMHVLHGDSKSKSTLTKMHRYLANKVSETAATANWVDTYDDDAHLVLHSSRRADGVLLESLIEDKPKDELIPKIVRGLLAHRKRGRWGNTQENVFALLAMDKYFHTYEKVTPNFVARMWLGDNFAGEQKFKGRSTDRHDTDIPMSFLAKAKGDQDLVISKKGPGRLYYRVGMTYAPSDLKLPAADHGFAIERSYEGVDDPTDVVRQKDGSWKIKAGTRVRVRLTMVAENRRYHVALVDPMPAGLEPMNPALAVTGTIPQDTSANQSRGRWWWWSRTWYEHQNMRDERVEAFTSLLWAGVHKYSYVTRATTPGRFIAPPTKAEEMYFPETFGRSESDIVIVE